MEYSRTINRKVYALGETVLDLISDGDYSFRAIPGGSVLNTSVSLGRMNAEVFLMSEYGSDIAGNLIDDFLKKNNVHTGFCLRQEARKTSLALAFLDKARNATYSFYHDTLKKIEEFNIPVFEADDILLFGSFYSVKPDRREFLLKVQQRALEAKCLVYYDLNIRKAHSGDLDALMPSFMNNISVATIVKGSDEDFYTLFGLNDPDLVYEKISRYSKVLIITSGAGPVHVYTPAGKKSYKVPAITPVSTIGAGDSFNAGFIYGLVTSGINSQNIKDLYGSELDRFSGFGLAFAIETCLSHENYITNNFDDGSWKKYI